MTMPAAPLSEQVLLAGKTSFAIGGPARYYSVPESTGELLNILEYAHQEQLPLLLLGKGTNLLVSDSGWPGLVVHLTDRFNGGAVVWDDARVTVAGGVQLNSFVKSAVERGVKGVEELAGIPGTIGGAVIMNAGAFSTSIADTLVRVTCCCPDTGEVVKRSAAELELGYRSSRLRRTGEIVLSAEFAFRSTASSAELASRRREILDRRKAKQPLEYPNCGSVFKRPPGNYAGTLIEASGLKGLRCGGAEVSTKHANFIVNIGRARADDVRHLIYTIQKRVWEQHNVLLEPEVIFRGHFDEPLFTPPEKHT
jgi:UDP-N-acetylmuramate dehydrogenase